MTLKSITIKVPTGHGSLYITISEDNGNPVAVFCTIGQSGSSIMAKAEAIGRLVSLALRHAIPINKIADELIDIGGEEPIAWKDTVIKSIPDAVGKVLKQRYVPDTGGRTTL